MRVRVDYDKCEGHALCVLAAPEVFELGDDDRSRVVLVQPGEELRAKVESAVRSCPKQAVYLDD
jgi:ferredoxin